MVFGFGFSGIYFFGFFYVVVFILVIIIIIIIIIKQNFIFLLSFLCMICAGESAYSSLGVHVLQYHFFVFS